MGRFLAANLLSHSKLISNVSADTLMNKPGFNSKVFSSNLKFSFALKIIYNFGKREMFLPTIWIDGS